MADLLECENPHCGKIFVPSRADRVGGCCSRACARKLEAIRRLGPTLEEKKTQFLSAMEQAFDRIFKDK